MEYRVRLHELTTEDRDIVFGMTSDPEVVKYMRFDTHERPEEAVKLIRHYTEKGNYGFLVRLSDSGEPVGVAALKREEDDPGKYSVSIFSFQKFWNQGYSTEVMELLIEEAKKQGIGCIKAYIVEENYGSRRVAEKCGFQADKLLHFADFPSGLYIYSWQNKEETERKRV